MTRWVDLSQDIEQLLKVIDTLPENLKGEAYAQTLVQYWGGDVNKTVSLLNYAKKLAISNAIANGEVKDRLPYEIHEYLYKTILETGISPEDAVKLATTMFDKTEEWINERKALTAPSQNRLITRSFDEHRKQRSMKEKGVLTAKDLKSPQTPASQLQRLYKGVTLYDWVRGLEGKVGALESEVLELKAVSGVTSKAVAQLEEVLGAGLSLQDKIQEMKDRGLSQKKVAELLDVSISTVKRKWKSPQ